MIKDKVIMLCFLACLLLADMVQKRGLGEWNCYVNEGVKSDSIKPFIGVNKLVIKLTIDILTFNLCLTTSQIFILCFFLFLHFVAYFPFFGAGY